jgi:hypothetical protein
MNDLITLENIYLILKIISIPAALKLYIMVQSLRLYGVYKLYQNRELISNHNLFNKLDRLYTDQELFNRIPDTARREIFKDIFKIQIQELNNIMISFRSHIYCKDTFFGFMNQHKNLDSKNLMSFFARLYNAHRDKLEKQIRFKLRRGGLNTDKIIFITQKFYEFTEENSFMLREKLEVLKERNNVYFCVLDLLDRIEIEVEAVKKFLPKKFSGLNGKLDNIIYKSYESYHEGVK